MSTRSTWTTVGVLLVSLLTAVPAAAQLTTGTVMGTVKDAQGGVVPGATVTLTSETRGTELPPAFTNASGDFVVVNVPPDKYIVQVTMEGFRTLRRAGISVSPGDRVGIGSLTIELGTLSETVNVTGEAPLIQAQSGERSYAVTTKSVESLPIANRSFTALTSLAPGMGGTSNQPLRIGDRSSTGGGNSNVMMDGISTMDSGSNSILLQMNVESIAEVKVLVSGYQAEYGRSSGVQVSAVTKSGTNQFRGSAYRVDRHSSWNSNSKTNILNGDPKVKLNEMDLGFSIGGPIGKPGGNNKLFFFYAHEFAPRAAGGDTVRYRFPTALERQGDFSQTRDNNGNLYPYIRDASLGLPCSASNTAGCFKDGGVLGKIPADRLYDVGLNILKTYPMPNVSDPSLPYNYELTRPEEKQIANQPAVRVDYQPWTKLRGSFKYSGWAQKDELIPGTIPGWNDTRQYNPYVRTIAGSINYSITPTTFLEATVGMAQNALTGCALAQSGTGPTFCRNAFPMNDNANPNNVGLAGLPLLFPNAAIIPDDYFAYGALQGVNPPIWDGNRISMMPNFSWGNRITNAPPNIPYPGYLNTNKTNDQAISVTKVWGSHTLKSGFYRTHSYKAQQRGGWMGTITFANDTSNPLDSQFGFANAALGVFSSYNQASRYVEGSFVYTNLEGYVQDNWKVNSRLTLDYGVRLVHQTPQYDKLGQASNFLPERWNQAQAPMLYLAGCAKTPCTGSNRQALDPRTGQLLGPNTALAIGTIIPNTGDQLNGLFLSGQGIAKTTYVWPALAVAPRVGMAYDLTGEQKLIVRGGIGLFFDRTSGNAVMNQVQNPPTYTSATLRYAQLQQMASGLSTQAAPALNVYQYKSDLPSTWSWNGGVQMMLPWATALDVEYTGQYAFNIVESVGVNHVDFGAAFLADNQDPTLSSATPGAAALPADQMRAFRGYNTISMNSARGWNKAHTLQTSLNRRFRDGLSFGFNHTWVLYQAQNATARLQHNADGSYTERADQREADKLLGEYVPIVHSFKANFVWDMPDLPGNRPGLRVLGYLLNDWQLSGVWTGQTGSAYNVAISYQGGATGNGNQNITGSPDYAPRVRIVGDTGSGCGSDPYRQLNALGFGAPLVGSVGLESGADYLRGCYRSVLDLSLARNIRFGGSRVLQVRLDMFNAPNQAAITGRNATAQFQSPTNGTITNLPYDASGNILQNRSLPKNAGFGVANTYQDPRTMQLQVKFMF